VADFWYAVTKEPEALLRLLSDTPITIEQWHHWRSVMRGEREATMVERGYATLFMNRTNRSGILKGGVIGGLNQDGAYLLDVRMKKDVLAKRIEKIAHHSACISVYNEDALELLKRRRQFLPRKSLVFLDPPYYVKGQGLYRNYYTHDDHLAMANLLLDRRFKHKWIVSYDDVSEIRAMYSEAQTISYGLHYTAQKRYKGAEVMFFPPESIVPSTDNQIC
jgi:DNA adenine methylase